ncbi:toxin co-regulated pilus biosynthesis Q family protein [Vogesella sp. XCS3]|uniref:toxin co-regulated pilus biosynthesis Q family protein n=1 Tax=Vogesella sp. XCS3 TaxID=2877939 RepID=UPI001D0B43F4|nr:toxin co-regulated pilus biosynthesis Q family protein [Vogesella sp. XCS3]UDM18986.1 toxin co-regulated pilus biosynthesis Q family protein [Vogesella sp. XCS3]
MKRKKLIFVLLYLGVAGQASAGFLYLEQVPALAEAGQRRDVLAGGGGEPGKLDSDGKPIVFGAERKTLQLVPGKGRISSVLRDFARANGWELAWEVDRDFPIDYPATFNGTFLDVIEQIAKSLQNTDSPVRVKVYEANKVLRVIHATR